MKFSGRERKMANWIVKAKDLGRTSWNIVKSVGPVTIAQFDKISKKYAQHEGRLANVEAAKEIIVNEAKSLSEVRADLLKMEVKATGPKRYQIREQLEYVEGCMRQMTIAGKTMTYLPASEEGKINEPEKEISEHWIDKFNELARARNEDWRAELLAKALAKEAAEPGTVSSRVLWILGTLEETVFKDFAALLELCSEIDGALLIPRVKRDISPILVPWCGENVKVGNLIAALSDVDFLSPTTTIHRYEKGVGFNAKYFQSEYRIECKEGVIKIGGVILTSLGDSIACFCERNYRSEAEQLFKKWIESLNKEKCEITEIKKENMSGPDEEKS